MKARREWLSSALAAGASVTLPAATAARLPVSTHEGEQTESFSASWSVVPIGPDREMVDAVREAGGRVRFTVYADIGHNAWDRAYADLALYDGLLAQRRGRPAGGG